MLEHSIAESVAEGQLMINSYFWLMETENESLPIPAFAQGLP